ncbi:5-oxoprolinase subunit PxpB [Bosea sp. 117]|uniref:5-oxoprolinase subunit PxpB n=1 Tax=Bosea sp. 117 TaxID=1125973 RepID=UPI00068E0688|nr:5-oxoprolinase subunit PxpB [Bosea sp. 117]
MTDAETIHHPGYRQPRFLPAGDAALSVELGDAIDETINARVVALEEALAARHVAGVIETVPTYRSLLVLFDPLVATHAGIAAAVRELWPPPERAAGARRLWRVPVCYGGEMGADLDFVARAHDLTTDEVVALHTAPTYRVYMIGFAPGFAYLGGLDERLVTSRREVPRPKTPPGSISIGGRQAAVSPPMEVPSGWHLLGRTAARSYDPRREQPFLFGPGDLICFHAVDAAGHAALIRAAEAGEEIVAPEEAGGAPSGATS